jgi:manganese-dependent ADP-ribose/CDP-alcohol diphosphatase
MHLFSGTFSLLLLLVSMIGNPRHTGNQGEKPLFSFGVIADVQYADVAPAGKRYYNLSAERLKEAYKTFAKNNVEFVVNLGDLIDRDAASYGPVMDIIGRSPLKTWHVAGNHDYTVENSFKKQLPVLGDKGYYSFVHNGFRFIFLNGNEISTYAPVKKSEIREASEYLEAVRASGEKNGMEWNGAMSKKQVRWLAGQINDASEHGEKTFIMCHFPVFPEDVHNLLNYREVLSILANSGNVASWFAGHNHAGNYGRLKNIHFVTFRGMVETAAANSYAIVEVYADKFRVRGFGRETDRVLFYGDR